MSGCCSYTRGGALGISEDVATDLPPFFVSVGGSWGKKGAAVTARRGRGCGLRGVREASTGPQAGSPDLSTLSAHHISPLPDFLPLKCDACEQIFCTDHIAYAQHDCTSAYKKVSVERRSNPTSRTALLNVLNSL